jgi:hypothetical protein
MNTAHTLPHTYPFIVDRIIMLGDRWVVTVKTSRAMIARRRW